MDAKKKGKRRRVGQPIAAGAAAAGPALKKGGGAHAAGTTPQTARAQAGPDPTAEGEAEGEEDEVELTPLERAQLASLSVLQRMLRLYRRLDDPQFHGFGTDYAAEEKYTMQVLHPGTEAGKYRTLIQQKWLKDNTDGKASDEIRYPKDTERFFNHPDGRRLSCETIAWDTVMRKYLECQRTTTPFEWTGLEELKIPDTDPRVALRGQLGLYVRDGFQIEAGTVLGPYVTLVSFEDEKPPSKALSEDLEEERYMFDFFSFGSEDQRAKWKVIDKANPRLNIKTSRVLRGDGHKAGCLIRRANDYHFDPVKSPQGDTRDGTQNCMFVECFHRDWPYVFVVAKHRLRAGEELLLDYGEQYWAPFSGSALKQSMFRDKCISKADGIPVIIRNLQSLTRGAGAGAGGSAPEEAPAAD